MDFWVNINNGEHTTKILERLASLGFNYACVCTRSNWGEIKEKANERGITVFYKQVIHAENRMDVLNAGRQKRHGEILSIIPSTREAFIVSARDERVDTVIISPEVPEIDRHILQVLRNFIEIPLEEFMEITHHDEFLRKITTLFNISAKKDLRLIISSGSSTEQGLRNPRQLSSIAEAFGFATEKALDMISKNPLFILEKRGYISE